MAEDLMLEPPSGPPTLKAAEDIEVGDAVYLKPDGTVGVNDETKRRRERDRMLWENLFREVRRMAGAIEEPATEPSRDDGAAEDIKTGDFVWKTVTRDPTDPMGMTYLYDPGNAAPEPPRTEAEAEDAAAPQPPDDGLTWRQQPGLL